MDNDELQEQIDSFVIIENNKTNNKNNNNINAFNNDSITAESIYIPLSNPLKLKSLTGDTL